MWLSEWFRCFYPADRGTTRAQGSGGHALEAEKVAEAADEASNRHANSVVSRDAEVSKSESGDGDGDGVSEMTKDFKSSPISRQKVPKSFYFRDKSYRQKKVRAVEPRSQGRLQARKVELLSFGGWHEYYCTIRDSRLLVYELASVTGKGYDGEPHVALPLIGSHLTVDHASSDSSKGFKIKTAEGVQWAFITEEHEVLLEWMQFFTTVAGLYRRPEDFYLIGKKLGEGATCRAMEARSLLTGKEFVLKVRVDAGSLESTKGMHNELRILQRCEPHKHPAIPHLEDYFFDQDGKIAVVMEKFEGGELFDRVMGANHFTEQQARAVFKQLADGVAFLHSLGIAHRDLKPSNTLIRNKDGDPQVAIVDYDLAKVDHSPVWQASTPCGTTPYMAPEMVRHKRRYSPAVDMWSLGCMLHVLLTGRRAFNGKTDDNIKDAITNERYNLSDEELEAQISPLARDLLYKLLAMNPEDRLTAKECLEHPWLQAREDQLPSEPLPSPGVVRSHFTPDEIRNLSSEDVGEAGEARTKLRGIVDADHITPPEGRHLSMDGQQSIDCTSAPDHKRDQNIESLKILLEEASAAEYAEQEEIGQSPNVSHHGSSTRGGTVV